MAKVKHKKRAIAPSYKMGHKEIQYKVSTYKVILRKLDENMEKLYFIVEVDLYWEGVWSVNFLNIRLKADFELNPQSRAIPKSE